MTVYGGSTNPHMVTVSAWPSAETANVEGLANDTSLDVSCERDQSSENRTGVSAVPQRDPERSGRAAMTGGPFAGYASRLRGR